MEGSKLVPAFMVGVVVVGAGFWGVGLRTRDAVTAEAHAKGLRELSREEMAVRVAKEDMFGLPSRLPDAPGRDIERAYKEATLDNPLPATLEGVASLVEIYAVTVRGCRSQLPPALREQDAVAAWITLAEVDGHGRVVEIEGMGMGEGQAERAFTQCVLGGVQQAVFTVPETGQKSFPARLVHTR